MSNSFGSKIDPRKGIEKGKKLSLSPLNKEEKVEFIIEEEVGRGGSVITYKAKFLHNDIEETCYLKELYPFYACVHRNILRQPDGISLGIGFGVGKKASEDKFSFENSEEWESLRKDYERIKNLRSLDNAPLFICDVYEIYHNGCTCYMQVPFESDKTLGKYIEKDLADNKNLMTILQLGKELAVMTQQLHGNGYLHLDIKPENLLYKSISADAAKTLSFLDTGSVVRTEDLKDLEYMPSSHGYSSPEQEHRHIVDAKCPETADIFSIGAVIFKMLTGKEPNEEDTETVKFEFNESDPLYIGHGSVILEKLNELLRRTLSFDPSFRFQCCQELVDHLKNMISETPFDRAFNNTREYLGKKSEKVLFKWRGDNFEKELFTEIIADGERYSSVNALISQKTDKKKFWLCGQGGCGKSAHLKRLAYDLLACKEKKSAPIYIDADTISFWKEYKNNILRKAICDKLQIFSDVGHLEATFNEMVRPYNFTVIVDGLNETKEEIKQSILCQIDDICSNSNIVFVVSDRNDAPTDYLKITTDKLSPEKIEKYLSDRNICVQNEKLCDMLSQNLFLLSIFTKEETRRRDKNREFNTEAEVLSEYTNGVVSNILASLREENRSKTEFDIAKAFYEKLEYVVYHSIDKNTLYLNVTSDGDEIKGVASAIKNCGFVNSQKFVHESIRDFLVAHILRTKNDWKNTDLLKDLLLPRAALGYLADLAEEWKVKDDELNEYNDWLKKSLERIKDGGTAVEINKDNRKITAALIELKSADLPQKYTCSAVNLITAILLGRGYDSFGMLEQNSPNLVNYLLNLEYTNATILEDAEEKYGFLFTEYIGKEANKKREDQRIEWEKRQKKDKVFFGVAKTVLAVLAVVLVCIILNIVFPHVEIESTNPVIEGVWVADETWFHTGFKARSTVRFYSYSDSKLIMSKSISPDDFITEGFTADISLDISGNEHTITLKNVKPSEPTLKARECRLILKRGVIGTSSGITSRKNKETEICRFSIFSDNEYKINDEIYFDTTAVEIGSSLFFDFEFYSKKPFESSLSAEDLIFKNFTADTEISISEISEPNGKHRYSHRYFVELHNIQPTGEGDKYVFIREGIAQNEYGVHSFSVTSDSFEILDKLENLQSPEVSCKLFCDDAVAPGASLLFTVDFTVNNSETYDTKFSSHFTHDTENLPFSPIGFSYDSVYISEVSDNAHKYWLLLSGVYPEEGVKKYGISINENVAVTQSGSANYERTFRFDIPFTDTVTDSNPPVISVEPQHYNRHRATDYYTNPVFILKITDDSFLPYLSPDSIKSGIRVLNADCGDIVVKDNGGWASNYREYKITLYDFVPKSSYENVVLQFVPGAVTDSAGNLSEELRVNVFDEETLHLYCDFQKAVVSPEVISFSCEEVEVYDGKTEAFDVTCLYSYNTEYRMEGFKANVVKVDKSDDKSMIELTNVQFDEGVDTGTLTLYAINTEREVYKATITVKKSDTN